MAVFLNTVDIFNGFSIWLKFTVDSNRENSCIISVEGTKQTAVLVSSGLCSLSLHKLMLLLLILLFI